MISVQWSTYISYQQNLRRYTAIFERAKKASPIGLAFLYDFVRFLTGVDNMQFFSGLEGDKRFWFFQRCV